MESKGKYDKYVRLLRANKNLILTGAPGTGKTFLAKAIARDIIGVNKSFSENNFATKLDNFLKPNMEIVSSKGKTRYIVKEVDKAKSKVLVTGETISPKYVPFKEIEKAYNKMLWCGGQKNGYDSYSSALAKCIYENESAVDVKNDEQEKYIEQVQFHPSYDYTDFVEGLRPISNEGNENIGFERKDGVFKAFCRRAIQSEYVNVVDNFEVTWLKLIELLSSQGCLEIRLLSGKQGFRLELNVNGDGLVNRTYENGDCERNTWIHGKSKFFNKGQLYKVYKGLRGTPSGGHDNYRKAIIQYMKDNLGLKNYSKGKHDESVSQSLYVFIIDEINRGEISKIFGELFFSIDPGYRGEKGLVKTQYQNMITDESDPFYKGFYVPENVYILGTMNDIDRSVESMDFAMRRRFAWMEVKALENTEMLDDLSEMKEEVLDIMKRLNTAIWDEENNSGIEGLSASYHIGGAYFSKLLLYLDKEHENKDYAYRCLWENHLKGVLYEYLRGTLNAIENLKKLERVYFNGRGDVDIEG